MTGYSEILVAEREKHLRIVAGLPDGVTVDLSLVKLPDDALMFPGAPGAGEDFSFTKLRNPSSTTKEFERKASSLGFRSGTARPPSTHETLLLDRGVPVHVVADRCGHDPAVLLRVYAKRTRKADTSAAAVISALAKRSARERMTITRPYFGSRLGPSRRVLPCRSRGAIS